jgi:hypothetical protein
MSRIKNKTISIKIKIKNKVEEELRLRKCLKKTIYKNSGSILLKVLPLRL